MAGITFELVPRLNVDVSRSAAQFLLQFNGIHFTILEVRIWFSSLSYIRSIIWNAFSVLLVYLLLAQIPRHSSMAMDGTP